MITYKGKPVGQIAVYTTEVQPPRISMPVNQGSQPVMEEARLASSPLPSHPRHHWAEKPLRKVFTRNGLDGPSHVVLERETRCRMLGVKDVDTLARIMK